MVSETIIKTRFCETDALGHVSNVSFFAYLEQARLEFLENIGADMDVRNWQFIVASVSCDFLKQVYFNQSLKINTTVLKIGNKSFQLKQDMHDLKSGDIVGSSTCTLIHFNFVTQQTEKLTDLLLHELDKYFQQQPI